MSSLFAGVLAALFLLALAPDPAAAHAVLVEVQPEDGVRLARPASRVPSPVQRAGDAVAVQLLDDARRRGFGRRGSICMARYSPVCLRPASAEGAYLLSYRVTSLDVPPIGATLSFGIGIDPQPENPETDAPSVPPPCSACPLRAGWCTSRHSVPQASPCSCFWSIHPSRWQREPVRWLIRSWRPRRDRGDAAALRRGRALKPAGPATGSVARPAAP